MSLRKPNPGVIARLKKILVGDYVETGTNASQNIPKNKYFVWRNKLKQAKTAIVSGDAFTEGTNMEAVSDGALNALNSKLMNLEDGQKLLEAIDQRKADMIVVTDSTPAAVMTFPDGADDQPMALKVAVEPVQDLHGYYNPWPAGGGRNLFDVSATDTDKGYVNGKYLDSNGTETTPSGTNWYISEYIEVEPETTYTLSGAPAVEIVHTCEYDSSKGFVASHSQGGVPLTFTTNATTKYIRITGRTINPNMQFEIGNAASAYEPYSNICPISGWTGANVSRTGKNLFNKNAEQYTKYGSAVIDGNDIIVTGSYYAGFIQTLKPGMAYKASYSITGSNDQVLIVYTDDTYTSGIHNGDTFTPTKPVKRINLYKGGNGTTYHNMMIVLANETDLIYEDYKGSNTYSITFPSEAGTVYGGTLTMNQDGTGSLVVDRASVDLGTLSWGYSSSGQGRFTSDGIKTLVKQPTSTEIAGIICSNYEAVKATSIYAGTTGIAIMYYPDSSAGQIWVHDTTYGTDYNAFKTAMSGVQLVYELATPVTYTLTAPQVKTLLGVNNIWADTGNILSVDYPADTKLYIDGKFASLQALILENISNT